MKSFLDLNQGYRWVIKTIQDILEQIPFGKMKTQKIRTEKAIALTKELLKVPPWPRKVSKERNAFEKRYKNILDRLIFDSFKNFWAKPIKRVIMERLYTDEQGWYWLIEDQDIMAWEPRNLEQSNTVWKPRNAETGFYRVEIPLPEIKENEQGQLHCENGPAISWSGGEDYFFFRGTRVHRKIIEKDFTSQDIEECSNAELRRIMIQIFGFEKYLQEGGFKLVQQDDFGKLYRKEMSKKFEPDLVFVEVVNSTPEGDGTYKKYVLPCQSQTRSAHEAVAMSFGLSVVEYSPTAQS